MIDRKLLKTNRWEDEEYLHARRTNALYNGGGGGRGGGGGGERDGGDADLQSTTAPRTHGGRNTSVRKGNLNFNFPGIPGLGGLFSGGGSRGGDVQAIIGSLTSKGISRKARYKVTMSSPAGSGSRDLSLRCESISMPGQNVRSVPDTLRFGPEREQAQGMTYGPISATFISDRLQSEKAYFEKWQYNVVDFNTWEPKYYNDYKGTVKIMNLDERNQTTYGVELFEAYPKLINAQEWGHSSSSAYQTITVEFTFHHWFPTVHGAAAGGTFGGNLFNGINFNFGLKFGGLSIEAALNLAKGGGNKDSKPKINTVQELIDKSANDGRGPGRVVHPNIYDHMKVRKPPPEAEGEPEAEPGMGGMGGWT